MPRLEYNEEKLPYVNLSEVAEKLGVSLQVLSRHLVKEQIPVSRVGYVVVIHKNMIDKIKIIPQRTVPAKRKPKKRVAKKK